MCDNNHSTSKKNLVIDAEYKLPASKKARNISVTLMFNRITAGTASRWGKNTAPRLPSGAVIYFTWSLMAPQAKVYLVRRTIPCCIGFHSEGLCRATAAAACE